MRCLHKKMLSNEAEFHNCVSNPDTGTLQYLYVVVHKHYTYNLKWTESLWLCDLLFVASLCHAYMHMIYCLLPVCVMLTYICFDSAFHHHQFLFLQCLNTFNMDICLHGSSCAMPKSCTINLYGIAVLVNMCICFRSFKNFIQ